MLNERIIQRINSIVPDCKTDEPLSRHTTFKIGGNADVYVSVSEENQIKELLNLCNEEKIPFYILGNGSNVLVSDEGYRGICIEIGNQYSGIALEANRLNVKAGTLLGKVSHFASENNLTGLEFASGIPGTIGGAVIMNAGAYGGEMKQVVTRVKVMTKDGKAMIISGEEMQFGYRQSRAKKEGLIVLEAELELQQGDKQEIQAKMSELNLQRREKQPLEYPSAGSTFKRPEGYFAGKLISDCGLKGYSVGGAQVSEKHAGFLINKDNATAKDVVDLIKYVQEKVDDQFGVRLETEVVFLGEFQ